MKKDGESCVIENGNFNVRIYGEWLHQVRNNRILVIKPIKLGKW